MVKCRRLTRCKEERKVGLHFRHTNFYQLQVKSNIQSKLFVKSLCADVFDDLPASCCPAKYVDVCCPFAKPCNALAVTPTPSMMTSSPTQRSGGKPFCMKPQNSSACEAGFFFNKSLKRLEPCPDGKFVVS